MTIEKPLILQIEDMVGKDYLYMGKKVTIESAYVQRGENLIIKFMGEEKPLNFYFDDFRHIRNQCWNTLNNSGNQVPNKDSCCNQ